MQPAQDMLQSCNTNDLNDIFFLSRKKPFITLSLNAAESNKFTGDGWMAFWEMKEMQMSLLGTLKEEVTALHHYKTLIKNLGFLQFKKDRGWFFPLFLQLGEGNLSVEIQRKVSKESKISQNIYNMETWVSVTTSLI